MEFPNIRLPNQATNAILSNGYVRFRVRPRPWLTVGERIRNRSLLYFDFNAPVPTNTASTLVTGVTGLPTEAFPRPTPLAAATIWPNPATDQLRVVGWLPDAGSLTLRLLNGRGQVIRARQMAHGGSVEQAFDVRGLPAGLYLVELCCGEMRLSRRVVIN